MTRLSRAIGSCLMLVVSATALHAESKNPADYPYRLHIFGEDQTTFYHNRHADEAKGEGRANLFANGQPHAVDFSFDCAQKLKPSIGFETYPAKWKKPGQELVVLLPVFGHANTYFTCNLKTDVKEYAYARRNGAYSEEPSADFKAWMNKHEYDPEHGKNMPINPPATAASTPAATSKSGASE
jgi:hypothetical protein